MTDSDKLVNVKHFTQPQIPTSWTTNIPPGISTMPFEKYMQKAYQHRGKSLEPGKSEKDQEQWHSGTNESWNEL